MTTNRIKTIRQQKNLQQREVAERLNISQSAYAKLGQGVSKLDATRLMELATIFDVPYDELLCGAGDKHNQFTQNQITHAVGFAEHFYAASKETYEQHITQLMEVIRGLRTSQEQTQAANQLLLAEIRALRQLLEK